MRSVEEFLLRTANDLVDRAAAELAPSVELSDARLAVLEAVAAGIGGWPLAEYLSTTGTCWTLLSDPTPWAEKIHSAVLDTPVPPPLALAALSREILAKSDQRKAGAYYTDWRLAELLAGESVPKVTADGPWIDPACGSGVLLVAAAMATSDKDRDQLIRDRLVGADLSARALRGARLAVASLTSDLSAVAGFHSRLLLLDSLRSSAEWAKLAPKGAALVIGNPPWEKLRVSRHETATANGVPRHYGQSFDESPDLLTPRADLVAYISEVASGTRMQGKGEHDLYKLFLELGIGLAANGGVLALLVPAGLIQRKVLRIYAEKLDCAAGELSVSVIENRARNFAIDTRFKFLSVVATIGGRRQPLALRVADRQGALPAKAVRIKRGDLVKIRADLSVPEVRTDAEWELYRRLATTGVTVGDPSGPWHPEYRREADMTLDRKHFLRAAAPGALPLLEGRHVAQYRWRAKRYIIGEGRAAIWAPQPLAAADLHTQWFMPAAALRRDTITRAARSRIAFCDITGQTNERSLLAARIPGGVVCGNKVPTLAFASGDENTEDLFLALANSLVVDWMLRRIVTTTVNFFLLDTLPLPPVTPASKSGRELINLARLVSAAENDPEADTWQVGIWRARIDALAAAAWGLSTGDMQLVLQDFPLIDRGQPALDGEARSTVTHDAVLATLSEMTKRRHPSAGRLQNAQSEGATPFVPEEFARREEA